MKKIKKPSVGRWVRSIFCRAMGICVTIAVIYFEFHYITNSMSIEFAPEDIFILTIFAISVIVVSILLIKLSARVDKLEDALVEVMNEVADAEDNSVKFSRITQELILELSNRFEVDSCEKKS